MEEIVPRCCCLRGFAPKESRLQGLDSRNVIQMTSTVGEAVASANEFGRELRE